MVFVFAQLVNRFSPLSFSAWNGKCNLEGFYWSAGAHQYSFTDVKGSDSDLFGSKRANKPLC